MTYYAILKQQEFNEQTEHMEEKHLNKKTVRGQNKQETNQTKLKT